MRSPPRYRYRILYVGDDYALSHALRDRLADLPCQVVRCPASGGVTVARIFIGAEIPYTLFLFDEVLGGTTGEELERFALSLDHRAGTPTLIVREADDVEALAERVRRLLDRGA
jgi:hypothetical protein